jgi:hypothetical protein
MGEVAMGAVKVILGLVGLALIKISEDDRVFKALFGKLTRK